MEFNGLSYVLHGKSMVVTIGVFCGGYIGVVGLKYRLQVIVLPIQKVSQKFVKANLRPN